MAIYNLSDLLTSIASKVFQNNTKSVSGTNAQQAMIDIAQSTVNRITDEVLLNIRDYQNSGRIYKTGEGCFYTGLIYRANKQTQGAFNGSDWDAVIVATSWGGISGTLSTQTDLQAALNAKQNNIGYVPENSVNKATTMADNEGSNIVYLAAKAIYDWATALFATISDLALKASITEVQNSTTISATTTGTGSVYVAALTPTLTSYVGTQVFRIKFHLANTVTNPTLNIDTLGALTIFKSDGTALGIGDIPINSIQLIGYDGSGLRLLGGGAVADATPSVNGVARLYTTLGTNVDGSVDQNTINSSVNSLQTQINTSKITTMSFNM